MTKQTDTFALVGRILIGVLFLMAGISKLGSPAATQGYIAAVGLPAPVAPAGLPRELQPGWRATRWRQAPERAPSWALAGVLLRAEANQPLAQIVATIEASDSVRRFIDAVQDVFAVLERAGPHPFCQAADRPCLSSTA